MISARSGLGGREAQVSRAVRGELLAASDATASNAVSLSFASSISEAHEIASVKFLSPHKLPIRRQVSSRMSGGAVKDQPAAELISCSAQRWTRRSSRSARELSAGPLSWRAAKKASATG